MEEMNIIATISDSSAVFEFEGQFSINKYHEFVISLTNIAPIKQYKWKFNFKSLEISPFRLIFMCLVLNNYLKEASSVHFIVPQSVKNSLTWFEPVWSSRIIYEVAV